MSYGVVIPVLDPLMRALCTQSYPGHKKGCPNYGKRATCPPSAPLLGDVFDLSKPVFAVWNIFDFDRHVSRMIYRHPAWSQRQLECCLWWQGTARAALQRRIMHFRKMVADAPYMTATECPEAMGVNVTETMKQVNVILEWPPKNYAVQVALAGVPK